MTLHPSSRRSSFIPSPTLAQVSFSNSIPDASTTCATRPSHHLVITPLVAHSGCLERLATASRPVPLSILLPGSNRPPPDKTDEPCLRNDDKDLASLTNSTNNVWRHWPEAHRRDYHCRRCCCTYRHRLLSRVSRPLAMASFVQAQGTFADHLRIQIYPPASVR